MAKISRANMICRVCAFDSLVLLVCGPLGARFGLWGFRLGMILMLLSVLLALIVLSVALFSAVRCEGDDRRHRLVSGGIALPALLVVAFLAADSGRASRIHNISTDVDDPPAFVAGVEARGEHSNPLAYTPEIAEQQQDLFPDLAPHESRVPPAKAFALAEDVAAELGWHVYAAVANEGRLEAVDTTTWFGFQDDVVVRIRPRDTGSVVDLRSVSRVGGGDLGANAARIRRFLSRFEEHQSD